jgi:regulatory protein
MTIISLKSEGGGEAMRIELSDGSLFSFKPCYLPPAFIDESLYAPGSGEGREIGEQEEEGLRFACACLRAEKAALRLIARAEQNSFGLSRTLGKRGFEPACVRQVASRLEELELLDNRRYTRLWLESRLSQRTDSPRRLLSSLCARGIDREDAESGLKAALTHEAELLLLRRYVKKLEKSRRFRKVASAQATRSFDEGPGSIWATRSLKFYLKTEGFSSQAIQQYFDEENDG